MKNVMKKMVTAVLTAAMLPINGIVLPNTASAEAAVKVTLNPAVESPFNDGRFEGWGTSLCWWANRVGYSEELTEQAAQMFFSEDGLGLDIARYNVGGGDNPEHNHVTRSDSKVPGYATGFDDEGKLVYDWTADENQRNVAIAAKEANSDLYFEGFSNSPPYFMTNSGCSSGAENAGSDNLKLDMYENFAQYIADVTKHFKDEWDIEFESYSPMNEPDTTYWGANSPKQEGCHYDPGTSQSKMLVETRKALDAAGLNDVLVAGMDETSIDKSVTNLDKLTDDAKNALGRIDTHTYSGSKRTQLKNKAVSMDKNLWMSEVDGSWDAFGIADRIITDMNGMMPSAWVIWDIVDSHKDSEFTAPDGTNTEANTSLNVTGKMWGIGMANHDTKKIEVANKYYAFGQFTKYINPGDTIIESSDKTLAAYNKDTGTIKIVALNSGSSNIPYVFDLSSFSSVGENVKQIRTDNSSEKWAEIESGAILENKKLTTTLKAQSITTYIVENNIDDIGYITINGSEMAVKGKTYTYTSITSDGSDVVWSVSDTQIADIDAQTGVLTPLKGGVVTVTAASETIGTNSIDVIVSDSPKIDVTAENVYGTNSWNNVETTNAKTVVDGDLNTYFDGLNAGYVILDLGASYNVTMIGYAPRNGYEYRMTDGKFSGSNDFETWSELMTVTTAPMSGEMTYVMNNDMENTDKSYRYIKYEIPSGKQSYNGKEEDYNCNVSEIEIYGSKDENAVIMTIVGEESLQRGNTSQYTAVFSGADTTQVYDTQWSVSDESVASIDENGLLTAKALGNIVVTAKSPMRGLTAVKNVSVEWAKLVPVNVSGSAPWNNVTANGPSAAVDGNEGTYFDGLSNGYVLLDFGKLYTIEMLGYAPRKSHEKRMPGVSFMASEDGENWNTIYSVTTQPSSGMHYFEKDSLQNVDAKAYRYVKCQGTDYCNIAEIEVYGEETDMTDEAKIKEIAAKITVPETVYGNLYMPAALDGATVIWTSDKTDVINTDGTVSRGTDNTAVKLTADIKYNNESMQKTFDVTVKAKADGKSEEDMKAYLFVHFVGTESTENDEQIYFSVSKDGTSWKTLNIGMPILKSDVGEKGVRDPHIIRSPEGDKFFLIATDLSIYNRRSDSNRWSTCQTSGSKSVVIWESVDLVNWSEARLVKVSAENAGCTWAPESIYDDESGRYMVFWASKTSDDNYSTQRIYRSYTRDFKNFTEPEVYIEDTVSNIDTTFIKEDGIYYRFTKNESNSSIIMEKSSSLDGEFEDVSTYTINGTAGNAVKGYEGPTAYKLNGENKWCLLLDYYSKSAGYKPFITDDISKGVFTSGDDFKFDTKYRHGTVMAITQAEYDALTAEYPIVPEGESGDVIFSMNFDNENAESPEIGTAKVNGTIEYTDGFNGKAAKLDGSDFIEITNADGNSLLTDLDTFTVEFMSKTDAQSWWFYAAPNTTAQTYKSEKYAGVLDSGAKLTAERYNSNAIERPSSAVYEYTNGEWKHVAVVHNKSSYTLYVNGEAVSTVPTDVALKDMLGNESIAYIGKANWSSGEYSSGLIDEFKVYNYALGADDVKKSYNRIVLGDAAVTLKFGNVTDDGKITYTLENAPSDSKTYIALKDSKKRLIEIKLVTDNEFKLPEKGGYTIEAFVWNDEYVSLIPNKLSENVQYN